MPASQELLLQYKGGCPYPDQESPLREGIVVYVPGDEMHQFVNTGPEVLRFICVVPHTE